ncbi:MAG: hypothetical protein ACOVOD_13825 [Rhodoferax sp.]
MTNSKKLTLVALVLGASMPVAAFAGDAGTVYTQIGTAGLGIGYGASVAKDWAVRGQINALPSQSYSGSVGDFGSGSNLDIKLDWNSVNLVGDWYPSDGGFRVTGGVILNNSKVTISGTGQVNGTTSTVNSEIKLSDGVSPYLGIGYGTRPKDSKGFGFNFDLGVAFNNPTVSLTAQSASASDIAAQKKKVEDAISALKTFPVFGIGISYSF